MVANWAYMRDGRPIVPVYTGGNAPPPDDDEHVRRNRECAERLEQQLAQRLAAREQQS